MNKVLVATSNGTDVEDVASITLSDKKSVSVFYKDGRIVQYLYNAHFDRDEFGKAQWRKDNVRQD